MSKTRARTRQLLVDGDMLAFKAAAAAEKAVFWGNDFWTLHAHESDVKQIIDNQFHTMRSIANTRHVVFALTSQTNFRKGVDPTYKAHRAETRKPMLLNFAKEYLHIIGPCVLWPHLEGDDVLGILMTQESQKYDNVLWSGDKDLKTIPGFHLNIEDGEVYEIDQDAADRAWMRQTLVGDTSDGYKGCPGSGPKDVEKIFDKVDKEQDPYIPELEHYWAAVVARFEKAGLTSEDALNQARLARILRAPDYNHSTGEITLWTPPEIQEMKE